LDKSFQVMYTHLLHKYKDKLPGWSLCQIKNTLLMLCLLLDEKTVNLWKLKGSVGKILGNTRTDSRSHYQRIKRWLWFGADNKRIWLGMLKASASLLEKKSRYLILDGTSWKYSGKKYHFLTLSLLYQGISIPIWWQELAKLGISSQWQRKLLLRTAQKLFNLKGKILLADREYIGTEWFKSLHQAAIGFVIRLREKNFQQQIAYQGRSVSKLESKAKSKLGRLVWKKFELDAYTYYYVLLAYKTQSGKIDFLRLISTLTPALAAESYGYRYKIESMFKHLKSNGFELESLHVKQAYKVNMMMATLVLAYTLSVVEALKNYKRRIGLKKHGSAEMSMFRYGLDLWQNHLRSFTVFIHKLETFFDDCIILALFQLKLNVP
jgi:hypothetical protein